jgi:hypothetical protein
LPCGRRRGFGADAELGHLDSKVSTLIGLKVGLGRWLVGRLSHLDLPHQECIGRRNKESLGTGLCLVVVQRDGRRLLIDSGRSQAYFVGFVLIFLSLAKAQVADEVLHASNW